MRQAEGLLRVLGSIFYFKAPDFRTIWRREMSDTMDELVLPVSDEHVLAIDSTGLSITTRGEYLAHRYGVRRGFVKLHAAVDISGGAVVAATATGGRRGHSKHNGGRRD